jgi:hypothetical protein
MTSASLAHDRPCRTAGLLECEVLDETLLYLDTTGQAVALNSSAREIWQLCGGEQSIVDIGNELGQRYGVPGPALLPDIRRAVARMRALGLLEPPEG